MTSLLLVEDENVFRDALVELIDQQADLQVAAHFGRGDLALEYLKSHQVDLVLLDLKIPGLSGSEVLRAIRREKYPVHVLILSGSVNPSQFAEIMDLDVQGFLDKTTRLGNLLAAIRSVAQGGVFFDSRIMKDLRRLLQKPEGASSRLTPREKEILAKIARGKTCKEIAVEFGSSPRTVEKHKDNICQKLETRGLANLTRIAMEMGLVD